MEAVRVGEAPDGFPQCLVLERGAFMLIMYDQRLVEGRLEPGNDVGERLVWLSLKGFEDFTVSGKTVVRDEGLCKGLGNFLKWIVPNFMEGNPGFLGET